MRKLVLGILGLLALFSALRAYTEPVTAAGVQLHPGLVEVSDGGASVELGFGIAEKSSGQNATWSLLPLRLVYRNGDTSVSLGLNGLSFLLRGGLSVGKPVRITGPQSGDVISIGGKVTVGSRVDGDVWALGACVELLPKAEVTGNIVVLGGTVTSAAGAVVRGTVNQVAQLKIPFLGFLGGDFSVQILALGSQLLGFVLLAAALFVSSYYGTARALAVAQSFERTWRTALVTALVSLVVVPLLAVALVASVIGIFLLPVLALVLVLLGLNGFLMLCVRLGGMLRKAPDASSPLFLFTSGLLGLFLVKVPAIIGIGLTVVRSPGAVTAGQVLQLVSLGLLLLGMLYGMSASLSQMRSPAARARA